MKDTFDVSIIIVNYNTTIHLRNCLISIEENLNDFSIEVIVIDNNSTDRQIEIFPSEFPGVKFLLRNTNDGFSGGCNYGAEKSKGNSLMFLNPDILLIDNSILLLKNYLEENKDAGIVSGVMTDDNNKVLYFYNNFPTFLWEYYHLIGYGYDQKINNLVSVKEIQDNMNFEVDWFHGAFMMMRREDFFNSGGFNENYFMYYEDVEICFKFKNKLKKKNVCIPQVVYRHFTQSSLNDEKNDNLFIFHLQRGKLVFLKNYSFLKRLPIYLTGLLYVISRIIILPVWKKYNGNKKEKLNQLLKVLKLYFSNEYLNNSKYEYIRNR